MADLGDEGVKICHDGNKGVMVLHERDAENFRSIRDGGAGQFSGNQYGVDFPVMSVADGVYGPGRVVGAVDRDGQEDVFLTISTNSANISLPTANMKGTVEK